MPGPKHCRCGISLLAATLALAGTFVGLAGDDAPEARLVVLISVDQLRADYLTRFRPQFEEGGFRRLMDQGAFFCNAHVSYGGSETAPGHATIGTGCLPRRHGIVANKWLLEAGVTKPQQPVDDPNAQLVGAESPTRGAQSPRALLVPTIGDQMKLADRRARVYAVALKDRAAIFMAGRSADGVYWCDKPTGRMVTSTFYATQLPAHIEECNAAGGAWRYAGQTWDRLLPEAAYAGAYPVSAEWSVVLPTLGAQFPHRLPETPRNRDAHFSELVFSTPFGNDLVLQVAQGIVEHENLGTGPAADLLCVGLSANDYVGHYFGPDSAEVVDMTLRTDRQLAGFFQWLDQRIGTGRYLIVLTADHGMSSSPHVARQLRLEAGFIDAGEIAAGLDRVLRGNLQDGQPGGTLVLGLNVPWLYCDPAFEELDAGLGGKLTRGAVEYLRSVPGIAAVYTASELVGPAPTADDRDRCLAWRSFCPGRSGHFYLKLAPGWFYKDEDDIAGHACGSVSDRHVPILLAGPHVRPGRQFVAADLTDIAVTIAALLGVEPPAEATGRVLHEAVDFAPGVVTPISHSGKTMHTVGE